MGDAEEVVETFLGFPGDLSSSGITGYEQIYDKDFFATAPSVSQHPIPCTVFLFIYILYTLAALLR